MSKRKRDESTDVARAIELICCRKARPDDVEGITLTPLERQVVEMRETISPSTILLVACGYRVKVYGRDSQVVSRRCGIMHIPGQPFPYSSIPYTRVPLYVHRLVSMGYHVAFADQESAAVRAVENKSGIFKRSISQVYSRGTLLPDEKVKTNGGTAEEAEKAADAEDENEADPTEITHTAEESSDLFICIIRLLESNVLEMVLLSFATMERKCFEIRDFLELEDLINRFNIVEIVVFRHKPLKPGEDAFTGFPEEYVKGIHSALPLNMGPTGNGEEDGKTVSVTAVVAKGPKEPLDDCISHYLELYHLSSVYKRLCAAEDASSPKSEPSPSASLDLPGSTLRALDVFHCATGRKGSLVAFLDHCVTTCGSRLLRKWIAAPSGEMDEIQQRQKTVSYLLEGRDGGVLEELLQECAKVGDVEATMGKLYAQRCGVLEYIRLLRMIRNVSMLASGAPREGLPSLFTQHLNQCCATDVGAFLESHKAEMNSTAANPLELFLSSNVQPPDSFAVHVTARDEALHHLETELERIRGVLKLPALEYRTVSGTPFVIDIPSSKAGKAEADWIVLSRTKTNVRYHTPRIVEYNVRLCAARERLYVAAVEAWDERQLAFSSDLTFKRALKGLINSVATLDVLRSFSIASNQPDYVLPSLFPYKEGKGIRLVGARHPVMERLSPDGYVGCNVHLPTSGSWVLTGPNMGGKSALMRMIGMCLIMAQCGCFIPAKEADVSIFAGLFCRMGASDSILDGRSTFLSEMSETSRILNSPRLSQSLVLMDELGRGTSSFDGASVASATLEYLIRAGSVNVFVTHYNYICEPFRENQHPLVRCYYMGFEEAGGPGEGRRLIFTYQPREGVTPSSFGVEVARQAGLASSVTDEAKKLSLEMEKELTYLIDRSKVIRFLRQ